MRLKTQVYVLPLFFLMLGLFTNCVDRGKSLSTIKATQIVITSTPPLVITSHSPQPSLAIPTPMSLSSEWVDYDFPELGMMISIPADWGMTRMPGGYFFAPIMTVENGKEELGRTQLTIGHQGNAPIEFTAMSEFLIQNWHDLAPSSEFYTQSIVVDGTEGIAFWGLSVESCVDTYVPVHGIVYAISFLSTFCNEPRTQLTQIGQMILDSIQLNPPTN